VPADESPGAVSQEQILNSWKALRELEGTLDSGRRSRSDLQFDNYIDLRNAAFDHLARQAAGTAATADASNTRLRGMLRQPWATTTYPTPGDSQLRDELKAMVEILSEQGVHAKATAEQIATLVQLTEQAGREDLTARREYRKDTEDAREQARREADRIGNLTIVLVIFTIAIVVLTGILVAKELGLIQPVAS